MVGAQGPSSLPEHMFATDELVEMREDRGVDERQRGVWSSSREHVRRFYFQRLSGATHASSTIGSGYFKLLHNLATLP